ncbi:DUF1214 domain-containing protein [Lutibaculum baratangense]|uniref:DUF1214 domain-containing protein n=1 Tax=Lutibaculum baratangense AMV1 TaxID=631454 RepID=V4R9A0_9HYPH|nr:DUF1214 domain-containing protein [Lutibaculum baratangense]ESR22776.1 hypothetical protein N177_3913 [Lutibaculum baratangense AMV1]
MSIIGSSGAFRGLRSFVTRGGRGARRGTFTPLAAVLIVVVAAALGIGSAWWAIDSDVSLERVTVGVWTSWPTAGQDHADPYLQARLARSGELVMSRAEGASLTAHTDESGEPLLATCTYEIAGRIPGAQWWTLTVYREEDLSLMRTPAERTSFRSDLVLRNRDDSILVTMSPRARPGNWLPVDPDAGEVRLVLRLYDTPIATGGKLTDVELPTVERRSCE